jgi:POT family proton-dependent oligopeptide transporter
MFIFILTPFLNMFWGWQSSRRSEPSSVIKMAWGCALLGISFLPLMWITTGLRADQRINFMWLVGCTLIYTVGELYLSPIGLSLVTKVAPARLVGMLMGMWFLSSFFGNFLSGYIGTYYEKMSRDSFFLLLTVLGIAAGAAIFALRTPLKNAVGHDT